MIEYLDIIIRPLVLMLPKMSWYVQTFKGKNKKLMSFCIDDEKLVVMYKTIWAKIENFKNIELNVLAVYENRYLKTKIRTYGEKV